MTYYSALHYAAKAEKSASTAVEAAEIAKQFGNDKINQTHITNCITEIPQDIKLELNNGTLTLKAGSKVYVPNGVGKFDEVIVSSDKVVSVAINGSYIVAVNPGDLSIQLSALSSTGSGTSTPITSGAMYYNTDDNKVYRIASSGGAYEVSLPIAIISGSGVITSIDQVFNGFGYIGSTVFALPGVKGLIPNGRNEDGSLRNREVVVSSVKTITVNQYTYNIALYESGGLGSQTQNFKLNELENYNYDNTTKTIAMLAVNIAQSGGEITSFTPKLPFRAVDYNDLPTITYWG